MSDTEEIDNVHNDSEHLNESNGDQETNEGRVDVSGLDVSRTEVESESQNVNEEHSEKILRLPFGRIKRIMKFDPEVNLASQEAVFLVTKATELLLDNLAKEAYTYTASENKKTVTRKHLESAINNTDALAFLDGALD